jgi:hypothetical protein
MNAVFAAYVAALIFYPEFACAAVKASASYALKSLSYLQDAQ